ncbi:hypothetical protein DJ568_03910 [Mucilaginibacter hurinus]|uniref:Glycosyltransferase 2-like domain-containing protein n=1 Tax=Mucilaginibacter hurinus TaxID=2201324 RepID=A0A367GR15_9SPHI|nr:glycosyltransferase [Mucilaginibacter hurinus]RCH55907.1 hypothetical protein DJ568_03910 [Mucilaginibacter hurinus]
MDQTPVTSNIVTILMATYNGERNLVRQLDSILNQTHEMWELIIRDDGSDDSTASIIAKYAVADPRIKVINTPTNKKGACTNFAALYKWAKTNLKIKYLMFTDQDDIWKPQKIAKTLDLVKKVEFTDPNMPIMAYGNLELVDDNEKKLPEKIYLLPNMQLKHLLTRNYAFGCTIMLNGAMVKGMDEISSAAENHDYWVALYAASFGKTVFIDEELILYRQHDNNVSGHVIGNQQLNNRVKRYTSGVDKQIRSEQVKLRMIEAFYIKYQDILSQQNKTLLFSYLNSFNNGRLSVIANMLLNGIVRKGLVQTMVSYYFMLLFYKKIKYKFNPA